MQFEKDIFKEINSFRQNPKSIQHQIEVLGKGISRLSPRDPFIKEINEFTGKISTIPKMPPLSLNQTLNQIAKVEVKKYSRNESTYNPYLSGDQLKGILPDGFLSQNCGLIADSGADEAQTVVAKLLLNKMDKEKKGRKILCTSDYTQVGIANTEFEGENYYVMIFAKNDVKNESNVKNEKNVKNDKNVNVKKVEEVAEGQPELPNIDLPELKQAFDLYDHDGSQTINIKECLDGLKLVDFDKTNPILYDIIKDLENEETCSWPKFAFHIYNCITDRNTDEGLRTLFDLFIDDPEKDTITLETFKRICKDVGDNVSDEELKNILEITTQSGNDISFDDFCQYMKLTA